MDTYAVHEAKFSVHDGDDGGDREAETDKVHSLEGFVGEMIGHLRMDGELLTRVELGIACSSEKLLNLNALMMNVVTREGEFEGFASEQDDLFPGSFEKSLEYDLLSRILYLEVRELQKFMVGLQTEIVHVRELISACKNLGGSFSSVEEKLCGSEESLKQLLEQVSDIRMQSPTFRRTLPCFGGEENGGGDADGDFSEDGQLLNTDTRIKMQTAEQQRDVLIMLEKSLGREMDLEQKLSESRQVEEELKQRLVAYENELCCMEEESSNVWEKLFEADHVAEVLKGTSKELLGRLHILQFNLNGALNRENELRSKFESADKRLKSQECTLKRLESGETILNDFFLAQTEILKASLVETEEKLIIVSSEAFTLREKVSSLENQLKRSGLQQLNSKLSPEASPTEDNSLHFQISELENVIEDLKENLSKSEARCKLLSETNMELIEEVWLLKGSGSTYEKVESLERQLQESGVQLQHAMASLEASNEKHGVSHSTISDMENLIADLKLKASKAENRADSTEDKCIALSELHADLNEKAESLERQLRESDIQLQHAVASLDASLEKQSMLYTTIADMGNLIEDLKLNVSKAESRADSAEDKCIILSESHADLNEELNFLRSRMECLEAALHQSEGIKLATAKDIGIRTKVITNLVMQLAIERERLHKQISSLAKENKILVMRLQQKKECSSPYTNRDNKEHGKDSTFCEHDRTTCAKEGDGEVTDVLTTSHEIGKTRETTSVLETETEPLEASEEIETVVRRIDAGALSVKHVFTAILFLLISAAAVYLFQQPNCPF